MACNHAGDIALRAFSRVFPVDAPDIAAADGGSLRLNEDLSVTWGGYFEIMQFYGAVARQDGTFHQHFYSHVFPRFPYVFPFFVSDSIIAEHTDKMKGDSCHL